MTQSLIALFSPETSPQPADLQPFRLLCDTLFFYVLPDQGTPPADNDEEQELWTGYTPVRLSSEDQSRFMSLARELKGHEAEFHGGLLASLSSVHGDRDEASVGALISTLRSGTKTTASREKTDEGLWQAMLILKLAEMFREEEREITQGFMAVSGKEAELFAAIRGEEEAEDEEGDEEEQVLRELAATAAPSGPTLNMTRLARAWGHFFIRDARAAEFPMLVTTQEELQGLLADTYETITGRLPRQLVSLAVPSQPESNDHAALVKKFKTATEASGELFNRLLLEVAASGTLSSEQLTELQGAGNELNRAALPFLKNSPNEKVMRFYAYEGVSLTDLFAGVCDNRAAAASEQAATGLLAVLS